MNSEEFFKNDGLCEPSVLEGKDGSFVRVVSIERAIEFAKHKVSEALHTACGKAEIDYEPDFTGNEYARVNKESILASYPLENIK